MVKRKNERGSRPEDMMLRRGDQVQVTVENDGGRMMELASVPGSLKDRFSLARLQACSVLKAQVTGWP
jgi:hypothetical protein